MYDLPQTASLDAGRKQSYYHVAANLDKLHAVIAQTNNEVNDFLEGADGILQDKADAAVENSLEETAKLIERAKRDIEILLRMAELSKSGASQSADTAKKHADSVHSDVVHVTRLAEEVEAIVSNATKVLKQHISGELVQMEGHSTNSEMHSYHAGLAKDAAIEAKEHTSLLRDEVQRIVDDFIPDEDFATTMYVDAAIDPITADVGVLKGALPEMNAQIETVKGSVTDNSNAIIEVFESVVAVEGTLEAIPETYATKVELGTATADFITLEAIEGLSEDININTVGITNIKANFARKDFVIGEVDRLDARIQELSEVEVDLSGLATETYVNNAIAAIPPTDLSEYPTNTQLDAKLDVVLEPYATEMYVFDEINKIPEVDLTPYAKTDWVEEQIANIVFPEIPDDLATKTEVSQAIALSELETDNKLTSYAKTDWVEEQIANIVFPEVPDDLVTSAEVDTAIAEVKTEVDNKLVSYAKTTWVEEQIANIVLPEVPEDIATDAEVSAAIAEAKEEIDNKLVSYATHLDVAQQITDLHLPAADTIATKEYVNTAIEALPDVVIPEEYIKENELTETLIPYALKTSVEDLQGSLDTTNGNVSALDLKATQGLSDASTLISNLTGRVEDIEDKLTVEPPPPPDTKKKYYVLPVAGQSNAVGYGEADTISFLKDVDPRIWQLGRPNSGWDGAPATEANTGYGARFNELRGAATKDMAIIPATPCLDHAQNMFKHNLHGTVGYGLYIAKRLLPYIPEDYDILIVPVAYGSTGFVNGGKWSNVLKADLKTRVLKAMEDPDNKLLPFVWNQGAQDGGNPSAHNTAFRAFYTEMKEAFKDLPTVNGYKWFSGGYLKILYGANDGDLDYINLKGLCMSHGMVSTYENYSYLASELPDEFYTIRYDVYPDGRFVETNGELGSGSTAATRGYHYSSSAYAGVLADYFANAILDYGLGLKSTPRAFRPIRGGLGYVYTDGVRCSYSTNMLTGYRNKEVVVGDLGMEEYSLEFNFTLNNKSSKTIIACNDSAGAEVLSVKSYSGCVVCRVKGANDLYLSKHMHGEAWRGGISTEQNVLIAYDVVNSTLKLFLNGCMIESQANLTGMRLQTMPAGRGITTVRYLREKDK